MIDVKKLKRDIDTLVESIELNRMNLAERSHEELLGILEHTALCMTELEQLRNELRQLTKSN